MIRPILTWPNPGLSTKCDPATGDQSALIADMFDTMYAAPGRGLAAPQIGVLARIFIMDAGWKSGTPTPQAFINPKITAKSPNTVTQPEGCLSLPGLLTDITRPASVTLTWTDTKGTAQSGTFTGFEAACIQHENDHLDGIVTLDHLDTAIRAAILSEYTS